MVESGNRIYIDINDIPRDLGYPAIWRVRGYTIKPGQSPIAWLHRQEYGKLEKYPLYHYGQLIWLKGKKAAIRRNQYIVWLYQEDNPM